MSEAWEAAQNRLRRRIWAVRGTRDGETADVETPVSAPLQPPDLIRPTIVSDRLLLGRPIRVLKMVLHRLLAPLVFGPQAEFNMRVAASLHRSEEAGRQVHRLSEINEENNRRIKEVADDLAELRGDLLAARAELQSQRVLIEKERQAGVATAGDVTGDGTG